MCPGYVLSDSGMEFKRQYYWKVMNKVFGNILHIVHFAAGRRPRFKVTPFK